MEEEEDEKASKKTSKSKKKAKTKAKATEEGGEEQEAPTGGSAPGDVAADGAATAVKKSKKGAGGTKGPKAYVTLPDGKLLSVRCPLGAEITNYAELSGALHDAITAQLESDGNASMVGVPPALELEPHRSPPSTTTTFYLANALPMRTNACMSHQGSTVHTPLHHRPAGHSLVPLTFMLPT